MLKKKQTLLLLISNGVAAVGTGVAMISVPWFIANLSAGGKIFGGVTTGSNIFLFLLTPFIGIYIDSSSRKKFMILIRCLFILSLGLVAWVAQLNIDSAQMAAMIIYYISGSLFYSVNIPLRTAFVQEVFRGDEYQKVNSLLEIENQVAAVITGALAVWAMPLLGLNWIIFFNVICYLIAILCLVYMEYHPQKITVQRKSPIKDLIEGIRIMKKRPSLSVILMCGTIPYVVVIIYNYIHPVILTHIQGSSGSDYAIIELIFGLGAIIAGVILQKMNFSSRDYKKALVTYVGLFAIIACMQAIFSQYWGILFFALLFGAANSLVRVLRQSTMMDEVPSHEIGRVGSVVQSFIMGMRSIFFLCATIVTVNYSIYYTIMMMGAVSVISFVVALYYYLSSQSVLKTAHSVGA